MEYQSNNQIKDTLIENISVGVMIIDPVTRVIESINSFGVQLFKANREDIIGKRCHAFVCPAFENRCPVCDLGLDVDNSEKILLRSDGKKIPILKTVKRINLNGEEKLLESFIDISHRKAIESELKEREERLSQILDNINEVVFTTDEHLNITYISPSVKRLFGENIEEYQSKSLEQKYTPDSVRRIKEIFSKEARKSYNRIENDLQIYSLELEHLKADGSIMPVALNAKFRLDDSNIIIGVQGVIQDISSLKQKEFELINLSGMQSILMNIATKYINMNLEELENTLNTTLGELATFVEADRAYIFDYDWVSNVCNNTYEWCKEGTTPEIENLQGVPLEYLPYWVDTHVKGETMYIRDVLALPIGDGVREILEPQGVKSLITIPIMDGKDCVGFVGFDSVEEYHIYTEKERDLLHLFAQMLVNVQNRKKTDIQVRNYSEELEKKNIELDAALHKAEAANRAKSEFLANMSHEIRTPMNAILGFSEVMLNTTNDPKQQGYLKTILNSGKNLLSIINDILDLSKIEAGRMEVSLEPTDLKVIIDEIYQLFLPKIQEKGLKFDIEFDKEFPHSIIIDEVRIRQILLNLVGNAVKFTNIGYLKIEILVLDKSFDSIDFQIDVIDTGIGINKEYQNAIFDSFTQQSGQDARKYGGTGLGLSITKRLIELMNGSIALESKENQGSKFCLTFENIAYNDDYYSEECEYEWSENFIDFSGEKILVVDDVAYNRELVVAYLSNYNIQILEAENGEIAVEMAKLYVPDLIFMDIRMPGLDGYDTTRLIKDNKSTSDIPIVALTASTMKSEISKINNLFDGFLRKPIQKKVLINEMFKFMNHITIENYDIPELDPTNTVTIEITEIMKEKFNSIVNVDILEQLEYLYYDEVSLIVHEIENFVDEFNIKQLHSDISFLKQCVESFELEKIQKKIKELAKYFGNEIW